MNLLEEVSTHELEQELNNRYQHRKLLQAIRQIEKVTSQKVTQATQTDSDGVTTIQLELK